MPRGRKIEDGKPPVRQRQAHRLIHPHSGIVRATVDEGARHAAGYLA
jgi:hypothetical protein